MIAACPKCAARYRVDESRIGPAGARLKCAKCQALFRVLAPPAQAPGASPPSEVATTPPQAAAPGAERQPTQRQLAPAALPPDSPTDRAVVDRDRLVVVADPNVESGKATVSQLSAWGLQPILVHDGVEAMLTIQRMLPHAVVLDAALPKMYGFQVCEVIKRNESLRQIGVILVTAIHDRDRYRGQPAERYAADHYIEQPDLPEGLGPLFEQMGLELPARAATALPAPSPTPEPAPVAASPPQPVQSEVDAGVEPPPPAPASQAASISDPGDASMEERADAERLARIIVSDIALYQPEKFAEAIRRGDVVETMDNEIGEGRVLFARRVGERIRAERDFIVEELLRVARERGMQ